ncbi:MAG: hypothetical protein Q8M15_03070 [Bacteroidota bacterium]|nr:hypothetical protein [Bacteroidota bacterium]
MNLFLKSFFLGIQILVLSEVFGSGITTQNLNLGANSNWRFGGGLGYSLYFTNQIDYTITTNYGNFNELIPSYFIGIYKKINTSFEVGIAARHASMLTLKSENSQGTQCDYNDVQAIIQYSFNDNIGLNNSRITWNAQIGLGAVNFRSMYFTVNTDTREILEIYSTLGYGLKRANKKDIADRKTVIVGNFGINIGLRVFQNMSVYFENSFNISTSNKMSGNLYKKSWIPPDCYVFSGVGIYFNLGNGGTDKRIDCPKF